MNRFHYLKTSSILLLLLATFSFSSCDDDDNEFTRIAVTDTSVDPIFLVTLYGVSTADEKGDLQTYVTSIKNILSDYEGAYVYSPIENQGTLDNDSSPALVTSFPGDYLTLIQFQNQAYLNAFLQDQEQQEVRNTWQGTIDVQSRFSAVEQLLPDGTPQSPIIHQEDLQEDPPAREDGPLFSLVGISFSANPSEQMLLNSFLEEGFPLLFQAGLFFTGSFFKVADIDGSFNYDALNFAIYTDSNAFFEVHNNDPFRQLANDLRNPALTAFAENQGRINIEIIIE